MVLIVTDEELIRIDSQTKLPFTLKLLREWLRRNCDHDWEILSKKELFWVNGHRKVLVCQKCYKKQVMIYEGIFGSGSLDYEKSIRTPIIENLIANLK